MRLITPEPPRLLRRNFLGSLLAIPAVVSAGSLMRVRRLSLSQSTPGHDDKIIRRGQGEIAQLDLRRDDSDRYVWTIVYTDGFVETLYSA